MFSRCTTGRWREAIDSRMGRVQNQGELVRRTLFQSELLHVGHVIARPASLGCGEVERQSVHVLVLPLAGVFAKHDGPRAHVIGTPNHAVWIAADRPYRISYPGGLGDECLTLRLSDAALATLLPRARLLHRERGAAVGSHVLLPPASMLTRNLLWRQLANGSHDPLDVEERSMQLLAAAFPADVAHSREARSGTRRRPLERVKEAVALDPARRWSLGELADIANVSPYHLAHVFRKEEGATLAHYVLRARLARALNAVLDTDAELAVIALDTGFASHSHLTARFRALFGVTPSELRRRAKPREAAQLRKIVTAGREAAG